MRSYNTNKKVPKLLQARIKMKASIDVKNDNQVKCLIDLKYLLKKALLYVFALYVKCLAFTLISKNISYFCKFKHKKHAGAGLSFYSCISYSVKGEGKAEMFSFHPLCFSPSLRPLALCSCLLSLGSHAWSPSVSADSRDERDGPGRVLGH